jgi:hypothetical protein
MATDLIPSKQALAAETQDWAARAHGLVVDSRESCTNASLLLRSIKTLRNQVQDFWAPHIDAAMETKRKAEAGRKALADERDRMEAPLVEAERRLKGALLAYEVAQEQARLEEEARLQAEAQRHAEAVTLAAAAAMERDAMLAADEAMLAEAESILNQPVEAPVVSVAVDVPRVAGVTYRDAWKAHPNIDVRALALAVANGTAPVAFLVPDYTAINQFARATKGLQPVPGIRWMNQRLVVARG